MSRNDSADDTSTDRDAHDESDEVLELSDTNSTHIGNYQFDSATGSISALKAPRTRLRDTQEKIVYFFALIVGSATILIGKSQAWLEAWPAAIGAVIFIVGYAVFAWSSQRENPVRADRMGDNCYYLGLVYTLASLIASLIRIQNGSEVTELIGNFGIALVSTAAGIVARLVMVQMRSETDDVDQRARVALADTAQQMQSDLLSASHTFRTLLIDAQETFRLSINRTEENVAMAEELSKKVLELEISPEELNASIVGVVRNLESATKGIMEAGSQIKGQSDAIATTAESVGRADAGMERINAVLADISTTLDKQRMATESALVSMEAQSKAAEEHTQKLKESAEDARKATIKVYAALSDLSSTIVGRLGK